MHTGDDFLERMLRELKGFSDGELRRRIQKLLKDRQAAAEARTLGPVERAGEDGVARD